MSNNHFYYLDENNKLTKFNNDTDLTVNDLNCHGNLGIGTTTPHTDLHIIKDMHVFEDINTITMNTNIYGCNINIRANDNLSLSIDGSTGIANQLLVTDGSKLKWDSMKSDVDLITGNPSYMFITKNNVKYRIELKDEPVIVKPNINYVNEITEFSQTQTIHPNFINFKIDTPLNILDSNNDIVVKRKYNRLALNDVVQDIVILDNSKSYTFDLNNDSLYGFPFMVKGSISMITSPFVTPTSNPTYYSGSSLSTDANRKYYISYLSETGIRYYVKSRNLDEWNSSEFPKWGWPGLVNMSDFGFELSSSPPTGSTPDLYEFVYYTNGSNSTLKNTYMTTKSTMYNNFLAWVTPISITNISGTNDGSHQMKIDINDGQGGYILFFNETLETYKGTFYPLRYARNPSTVTVDNGTTTVALGDSARTHIYLQEITTYNQEQIIHTYKLTNDSDYLIEGATTRNLTIPGNTLYGCYEYNTTVTNTNMGSYLNSINMDYVPTDGFVVKSDGNSVPIEKIVYDSSTMNFNINLQDGTRVFKDQVVSIEYTKAQGILDTFNYNTIINSSTTVYVPYIPYADLTTDASSLKTKILEQRSPTNYFAIESVSNPGYYLTVNANQDSSVINDGAIWYNLRYKFTQISYSNLTDAHKFYRDADTTSGSHTSGPLMEKLGSANITQGVLPTWPALIGSFNNSDTEFWVDFYSSMNGSGVISEYDTWASMKVHNVDDIKYFSFVNDSDGSTEGTMDTNGSRSGMPSNDYAFKIIWV